MQEELNLLERHTLDSRLHLRRNATEAERALWEALRDRQIDGFKFRRQHPVGEFVADFYCAAARLVVEVDGPVHSESVEADRERERLLRERRYEVLRVTNDQVLGDLASVLDLIRNHLTPVTPVARHPLSIARDGEGAGG